MVMLALKLLGLWRWLREALSALLSLAGRYPWQAALIASLCLSGWLWHGKGKALAERDAARATLASERQTYRRAMADAGRLENERLARVTRQQERINADVLQDFNRRIADARARADRVRAQANRGETSGVEMSGVPSASCRTDEAPSLELSAALLATEQAIQLDELISWIERQGAVEVTPE
ncbi:MAG: hypothetical protein KG075_17075 [Alphaproteobacteria bacterium]|nr:hypothetical protein [Alphaproteobacteria bacterium]